MKRITFLQLAKRVLESAGRPMTPEEIWNYAVENEISQLKQSVGKTPWRTVKARIYVDIKNHPETTEFVRIDSKPVTFYLRSKIEEGGGLAKVQKKANEAVEAKVTFKYHERDVHPFVAYFASTYLSAYTKTIKHERSSKKNYTKWLHPDIVGVNYPIDDWNEDVLDFGLATGSNLVTLYSFELKLELNFSNLRENFFQAVSNSSWANEGYLVATEILSDDDFQNELMRLSTSFGIGVIKLDVHDPDASQIIIPAKSKDELNWSTINKLAKENRDFRAFIHRIKNDLTTKEIRTEEYDAVLELEGLEKIINGKG